MTGERVYPNKDGSLLLRPGAYGQRPDGVWMAVTPNDLVGELANHTVTEHDDGTITVQPSILCRGYSMQLRRAAEYHGYLERGLWRTA